MAIVGASLILLAAMPTPAPVRVALNELVGKWATTSGDCSQGQHLLGENGKYKVWCFDSVSDGEWSLREGNKIVVKLDTKTTDEEIITIVRIERYSDHTVLDVRYQNGSREKWTK
ncbi:MAG TPA: hypothetical protein VFX07_00965 [Candidatus Udaeobacter sp.]|nr:hypothetical protein [Candidatus Udaeobacter sp.]